MKKIKDKKNNMKKKNLGTRIVKRKSCEKKKKKKNITKKNCDICEKRTEKICNKKIITKNILLQKN